MEKNNKLIVSEYIEKVLNNGDIGLIENYVSPEYTEVFNNQRNKIGIDGAKEHIIGVRKNYPDIKLTISKQICEGEWVVTCYTMRGTHSGSWMGIKPTGILLEVAGVNVDRVVNDKIIEHGGAANMFEGLLSIGAIRIVGEEGNKK